MTERPLPTPSQTVGPYLSIGLLRELATPEVVPPADPRALTIRGRLLDGEGAPVGDGMIETWQANAAGRYRHPADDRADVPLEDGFLGFGRCGTSADGEWRIVTVKPGRVPAAGGGLQAPHLAVSVFARGLLKRAATRLYFPDEAEANAADPLLARLGADERGTLVARADGDGLRFEIRLQGPGQTVFLAL
jgi:protocatechuate 3,4-dioxygenase, alpha subunit